MTSNIRREKHAAPKKEYIVSTFSILILLSLLVTGCQGTPFQSQTSTVDDRDSFASSRTSSDGFFVEWKGYREGYRAGSEAEFDLTIKNETDQPWSGRYCLQLMAQKSPLVITTLDQRAFSLRSGVGFSDTISVQIPRTLEVGAYGLSLVVRRPGGPMVDMVPIQVGVTDEVRSPATEDDMDAALEACPPIEGSETEMDRLVAMAKEDLAQRLGLSADDVTVKDIEATEFPDASLGVPEVGQMYAQVITPGYIILLEADGQVYRYHGAEQRVVLVPDETEASEPETSESLPEPIEGWVGSIYKLSPGNQFGQRFMRNDGEAFGISTPSESVRKQIQEAIWSGTQDETWGSDMPDKYRKRLPNLRRRLIPGADHGDSLTRSEEFHASFCGDVGNRAHPDVNVRINTKQNLSIGIPPSGQVKTCSPRRCQRKAHLLCLVT